MAIQSVNPATGKVEKNFDELTEKEIQDKLELGHKTYLEWRKTTFIERKEKMLKMAELYKANSEDLGRLATIEMGKTVKQAIAEVEKCAWAMEYYAEYAENQLSPQIIKTDNKESFVRFDPIGIILAVMPWNFPFWQVVRAIAPNLMAGNAMVLKHASNVPQVALALEEMTIKAGFPKGLFQTLLIGSSKVATIIDDPRIVGATLTGSEYAGGQVGSRAGLNIKPSVLELGGSDPFIVYPDCNLEYTIEKAVVGRIQNNGQSCIAAKRFIVHEDIYDDFIKQLKEKYEALKVGNPLEETTDLGPVVNQQGLDELQELIQDAVEKGATLVTGGVNTEMAEGFYCNPTIVSNITPQMRLYLEETFGPVASIYKFKTDEAAINLANVTEFGLGSSVWTKDTEKAKELAKNIEAGCVFINEIVRSNPHLPFGGIKKSGYGRELSEFGIREFVNIKTIVVK